jgi:hypothetical protein
VIKIFFLFFLLIQISIAFSSERPKWIDNTPLVDSSFNYVICSHSAVDPEDARVTAEGMCLASAAKLGGVQVKIRTKTIQSLTGADSSEVAEVQPLIRNVKCEFTDRYLENVGAGFRVWLKCRVKKSEVDKISNQAINGDAKPEQPTTELPRSEGDLKYQRGVVSLMMLPKADKVIVGGLRGERVIDPESNSLLVEIKEGDQWIEVKKHRYKSEKIDLGKWKHGQDFSFTANLSPEF